MDARCYLREKVLAHITARAVDMELNAVTHRVEEIDHEHGIGKKRKKKG